MKLNAHFLRPNHQTRSVRVRAVGDVSWGFGISQDMQQTPEFTPLPPVTAILGEAPLCFFNLECVPVSDSRKNSEQTRMAAPAVFLEHIRKEFNIVNVANNHITDAGMGTFLDILELLKKQQFLLIGGGKNLKEASSLRIVNQSGIRFGFIGCADFVSAPHKKGNHAKKNRPGVFIYTPKKIIKQLRQLKKNVDVLICSIHTGLEFHNYPDPTLMKDARRMIDAGADIILIHHAHVRQGIEVYKNGLIAYGLGNFIFDTTTTYMKQPEVSTDIGILLDILVDKQGIAGYTFWLTQITSDRKTIILSDTEKYLELYQEQLMLNKNLANPQFIRKEWKTVCRRYLKNRYYVCYWALKQKKYTHFIHLIWDLRRRENRRWISGVLGL